MIIGLENQFLLLFFSVRLYTFNIKCLFDQLWQKKKWSKNFKKNVTQGVNFQMKLVVVSQDAQYI